MTPHPAPDIDKIAERMGAGIYDVIAYVSYGLQAAHHTGAIDFNPPGGSLMLPFGPTSVAIDSGDATVPARFQSWLLTVGLRAYIEVYSAFLEQVALSAIRLGLLDANRPSDSIGLLGFPEKLRMVEEAIGLPTRSLSGQLRSINRARNCMEHQRGVVTEHNLGRDGFMTISWTGIYDREVADPEEIRRIWSKVRDADPDSAGRRTMQASPEDYSDPKSLVEVLAVFRGGDARDSDSTPELLVVRSFKPTRRRYEIGQAITLTEADFTGIGQTFLNHSTGIVARLKHHLQRVSPEH